MRSNVDIIRRKMPRQGHAKGEGNGGQEDKQIALPGRWPQLYSTALASRRSEQQEQQ